MHDNECYDLTALSPDELRERLAILWELLRVYRFMDEKATADSEA